MTIGAWIVIGCIAIIGIIFAVILFTGDETTAGIIVLLITIIICGMIIIGVIWYHNNTESGKRTYKDYQSNINGGINREIVVTAEDGREIYRWSGRCDIEDKDGYILFEDEQGKRHIIYYGALDTIVIEEK